VTDAHTREGAGIRRPAPANWRTAHSERRRLAIDLSGLRDEQWRLPSLCPGRDVHDVLAHLVDTARTGRPAFVRGLLTARLDFDRANENGIARHRRQDPQETIDALREAADLTRTPPVNLTTRPVEAVVHGEDIRRPLGLLRRPCVDSLTPVADFFARRDVTVAGRTHVADLRLRADDGPSATGSGPPVTGSTLALVMGMAVRATHLDELDGPGVPMLRAQLL